MSHTSAEKKDSKTSQTQTEEAAAGEKKSKASSDSLMAFDFGDESVTEEEEKVVVAEVKDRSTFYDKKYDRPTFAQYHRERLKEEPLFAEVLTLDKDTTDVAVEKQSADEPSMLVTGFGIRNLESFQDALREEQRRLYELYKQREGMEEGSSFSSVSSKRLVTPLSKRSSETETDRSSIKTDLSAQRLQLQYLMGLEVDAEEEYVASERVEEETVEEFVYSTSKSTKAAQRYLRVHRIFDFFQLIIAHLLSAMPDNPIDFILIYLNKCLCYRSGLGKPPLLYEQKHIEQLYILMDRMSIGYVELEQYEKAMTTLGICEYNRTPPMTEDKMVAREFFIQEALECETAIFDDLIRRRWIGKKPPSETRSRHIIYPTDSGPFFIPSDLLLKVRHYQLQDLGRIGEEEEGGGGE